MHPSTITYTIHHTPYTIHHTPYTIHHTPYTIQHTTYLTAVVTDASQTGELLVPIVHPVDHRLVGGWGRWVGRSGVGVGGLVCELLGGGGGR
jgi:hypothetical protein